MLNGYVEIQHWCGYRFEEPAIIKHGHGAYYGFTWIYHRTGWFYIFGRAGVIRRIIIVENKVLNDFVSSLLSWWFSDEKGISFLFSLFFWLQNQIGKTQTGRAGLMSILGHLPWREDAESFIAVASMVRDRVWFCFPSLFLIKIIYNVGYQNSYWLKMNIWPTCFRKMAMPPMAIPNSNPDFPYVDLGDCDSFSFHHDYFKS